MGRAGPARFGQFEVTVFSHDHSKISQKPVEFLPDSTLMRVRYHQDRRATESKRGFPRAQPNAAVDVLDQPLDPPDHDQVLRGSFSHPPLLP
jgi:hypothetical protein